MGTNKQFDLRRVDDWLQSRYPASAEEREAEVILDALADRRGFHLMVPDCIPKVSELMEVLDDFIFERYGNYYFRLGCAIGQYETLRKYEGEEKAEKVLREHFKTLGEIETDPASQDADNKNWWE